MCSHHGVRADYFKSSLPLKLIDRQTFAHRDLPSSSNKEHKDMNLIGT